MEKKVWSPWLAGDSNPSSLLVWVSRKASPVRFLFILSLNCGLLASSLGCSEGAQQAALSHSFEDSQRTEGCPGGCALRGKVSQHVPGAWVLLVVLSRNAFPWLGCCHRPPGRIPPLGSSDHWQTGKTRISNVILSHAGETSLGQRLEARSLNVTWASLSSHARCQVSLRGISF